MATYPPIGDQERDDALRRIALALDRYDDSRRSEAGTEAREVLSYVRSRHAQLPRALTSVIGRDELILSAWVYWDERRRERELLRRTLREGRSLAEVGAFLGIRTRQGMRDYLDRLDALLAEHHRATSSTTRGPATGDGTTDALRRHGARSRAERGADVHSTRAGRATARQKPTRAAWIERHHQRITATVRNLLEQCTRVGLHPHHGDEDDLPELGDYLAWLEEDLQGGVDHGSFGSLGLVLGDLRPHPSVTELATNHGLHQAIRAVDQLRADYADLTREAAVTAGPPVATPHASSTGTR